VRFLRNQRGELYHPTVQLCMVNFDPTFRHNLLQITIRNGISLIEKHRVQDHGFGIVAAFEINRHVLILTLEFKTRHLTQIIKQAQILKVCDRTISDYPKVTKDNAIRRRMGFNPSSSDEKKQQISARPLS
jgi:hypothetical protein